MTPPLPDTATLADVRFGAGGLACVVVQDHATGAVRMVAWANAEALALTLQTGEAHFFSRSRQRLWRKGEESGNVLDVTEIWLDCDGDTLVFVSVPRGPTCHTGRPTCFFRLVDKEPVSDASAAAPAGILGALDAVLAERAARPPGASYVASLLDDGGRPAREKVMEEAAELCEAAAAGEADHVAGELADLVFHALVAARAAGVTSADLMAELARRFGTSGHVEKAKRGPKGS